VEYEDRLKIATPEGVELTMNLAGAPSRFVAAIVDLTIQLVLLIALTILLAVSGGGGWAVAVWAILSFLVIFGYDVAFEVLNWGRTPGKQLNGLRVVRISGHPVNFMTSAIRNVIRPIDFLPGGYLLGATFILATSKNQRLGDIVAGTLVVRQRLGHTVPLPQPVAIGTPAVGTYYQLPTWDTSRITAEELATVTSFLDRRRSIDWGARNELANTLNTRLRPKVTGANEDMKPEDFLETLVAIRRTLGS
jgi:uncharacterized RDD family membrane protein YckC